MAWKDLKVGGWKNDYTILGSRSHFKLKSLLTSKFIIYFLCVLLNVTFLWLGISTSNGIESVLCKMTGVTLREA